MTLSQEVQLIVIQPQGRLDLQRGETLKKQLASLMLQSYHLCVIDLAKVDFMNSSGLITLVTGLKAARQNGCRVILCNVQAPVKLIFELTKLDLAFEILESYDDVLIKFNAWSQLRKVIV